MTFEWKGVFPALTTKFTGNDELDLPLFEKNLEFQLKAGIHGVILGGTLGEASVLSTTEKETLVKFTIEKIAGKIPVVINIAEGSTGQSDAEQNRFLGLAIRSLIETVACLRLIKRRNYVPEDILAHIDPQAQTLARKLHSFRKTLKTGKVSEESAVYITNESGNP